MNIKYFISPTALITLTAASCWGASPEKQQTIPLSIPLNKAVAYNKVEKMDLLVTGMGTASLSFDDISDDKIKPIVPAPTAPNITFDDIFGLDVFEHIINFLDQKSLMRMLLVNTKYNNVMKNIFLRECSLLIQQHQGNPSQALYRAIENNMLYAVDYLIKNRANVNARDENNSTLLILATDHNNEAIVTKLLEERANISATDSNDRTALMLATDRNYTAIVTQLSNALKTEEYNTIKRIRRNEKICLTILAIICFVVAIPGGNHVAIITGGTPYYKE